MYPWSSQIPADSVCDFFDFQTPSFSSCVLAEFYKNKMLCGGYNVCNIPQTPGQRIRISFMTHTHTHTNTHITEMVFDKLSGWRMLTNIMMAFHSMAHNSTSCS